MQLFLFALIAAAAQNAFAVPSQAKVLDPDQVAEEMALNAIFNLPQMLQVLAEEEHGLQQPHHALPHHHPHHPHHRHAKYGPTSHDGLIRYVSWRRHIVRLLTANTHLQHSPHQRDLIYWSWVHRTMAKDEHVALPTDHNQWTDEQDRLYWEWVNFRMIRQGFGDVHEDEPKSSKYPMNTLPREDVLKLKHKKMGCKQRLHKPVHKAPVAVVKPTEPAKPQTAATYKQEELKQVLEAAMIHEMAEM
jgi:hypothetical protein